MYEARRIPLAEALARLHQATGKTQEQCARAFWRALIDGSIRAWGRIETGKSSKIDRFMFKATRELEHILEQIAESAIIDWNHKTRVAWDVDVDWDEVARIILIGARPASLNLEMDFNAPRLVLKTGSRPRLDNKVLALSPQVDTILTALAHAALKGEAPVAKDDLQSRLFQYRDDKAVSQAISKLEKKLPKRAGETDLIENIRGVGWRLKLEPRDIKITE